MSYELTRNTRLPDRTLAQLTEDGNHFGYILEDRIREDGEYVFGETAIPEGEYRVIITYSNRFKRQMIQLVNKRGGNILFGGRPIDACGVRIHGGNVPEDTEGCPLLGANLDKITGKVFNCAEVVEALYEKVKTLCETQEVYLTVKNNF